MGLLAASRDFITFAHAWSARKKGMQSRPFPKNSVTTDQNGKPPFFGNNGLSSRNLRRISKYHLKGRDTNGAKIRPSRARIIGLWRHIRGQKRLNLAPFGTDTCSAKGAKSVLHHLAQSQDQRKTAKALKPCAQLEFQSTVWPLSRHEASPAAAPAPPPGSVPRPPPSARKPPACARKPGPTSSAPFFS